MSRSVYLSVIVVALSTYCGSLYWRSTPPYGVIDVLPYRRGCVIFNIISDIGSIYEVLGGDSVSFEKWAVNHALSITRAPLDKNVKAKFVDMDGIPVRVYEPVETGDVDLSKDGGRRALIYVHGGGFRYGHAYVADGVASYLVKKMGMTVFSIEYRYAPEHPSPAPFEDSLRAVKHIFKHAGQYSVDPQRISVAGESAGGNLAAALTQKLRDESAPSKQKEGSNSPQFCAQLVLVPWLQGVDFSLPSYQQNRDLNKPYMTASAMAKFTLVFLNQSHKYVPALLNHKHVTLQTRETISKTTDWSFLPEDIQNKGYEPVLPKEIDTALAEMMEPALLNPYNFPLMAENLANLPPAFVLVEENDVLRDEGLIYAARMERDGGDVLLNRDTKGHHCMIYGTHLHKAMQEVMAAMVAFLDNKCK